MSFPGQPDLDDASWEHHFLQQQPFNSGFRHTWQLSQGRPISDVDIITRTAARSCPYLRAAVTLNSWHKDRRSRPDLPLRPPCLDCGIPTSQKCRACDASRCRDCSPHPAAGSNLMAVYLPPTTPRYCLSCRNKLRAHYETDSTRSNVVPIHLLVSPVGYYP